MILKASHWTMCFACAVALMEYIAFGETAYLTAALIAFAAVVVTGCIINELETDP